MPEVAVGRPALTAADVDKSPRRTFYVGMKIIEYKTAMGDSTSAFDRDVNKLLGQGYQLYGNPYAVVDKTGGGEGSMMMAQALVKFAMYEKLPPAEPIAGMPISQ